MFNKGDKNIQWENTVSLTNGAGKIGQLLMHARESNCITFPYHIQK